LVGDSRFGFVKTLKENFNTGCFVPSEGTTQLLLNPHFRNKMQQFINFISYK
jgi:hypothetical protein